MEPLTAAQPGQQVGSEVLGMLPMMPDGKWSIVMIEHFANALGQYTFRSKTQSWSSESEISDT